MSKNITLKPFIVRWSSLFFQGYFIPEAILRSQSDLQSLVIFLKELSPGNQQSVPAVTFWANKCLLLKKAV